MSATYFWDGHQMITHNKQCFANEDQVRPFMGMPCVDGYRALNDPGSRFGKFIPYGQRGEGQWVHVPLVDFPKEFRAHLLLLGVS